MTRSTAHRVARAGRDGFTLTELLVAVVVLLVIILAVGRIFGTASTVVKLGEANSNLLQEVSAVRGLLKEDLEALDRDGFLVVQGIAVPNNLWGSTLDRLLDPSRPSTDLIRSDKLMFFTNGLSVSQRFVGTGLVGSTRNPQGLSSQVYYGHGIHLPYVPASASRLDPDRTETPGLAPWFRGDSIADAIVRSIRWPFANSGPNLNIRQPSAPDWVLARQQVILGDDGDSRPEFFMTESESSLPNAAPDLLGDASAPVATFHPWVVNGRVDVASTDLERLRDVLLHVDGSPRHELIAELVGNHHPRVEPAPPGTLDDDLMLSRSLLAAHCSEFKVEWTWGDGTGEGDWSEGIFSSGGGGVWDPTAIVPLQADGVTLAPVVPGETISRWWSTLPWFGFPDLELPEFRLANEAARLPTAPASWWAEVSDEGWNGTTPPVVFEPPIQTSDFVGASTPNSESVPWVPQRIEGGNGAVWAGPNAVVQQVSVPGFSGRTFYRYTAVFGPNGDLPVMTDSDGRALVSNGFLNGCGNCDPSQPGYDPDAPYDNPIGNANVGTGGWPIYSPSYTPWPSAIRVTMTLHDAGRQLEGGRQYQFTVPLPRRQTR